MNLVINALASVTPQGAGIECLNHLLYEGLPVQGRLADTCYDPGYLLRQLQQQLPEQKDKESDSILNILLEENTSQELLHTLKGQWLLLPDTYSALEKAAGFCKTKGNSARIFLFSLTSELEAVETEAQSLFCLEQNYRPGENIKPVGHYALGMQVCSESSVEDSKNIVACLESFSSAHSLGEFLDNEQSHVESIELTQNRIEAFNELARCFNTNPYSVALSSVACSFSYQEKHLEFLSLIKICLQCYHRYISSVPNWLNKNEQLNWQDSDFYVAEQSRSWFVDSQNTPRYCLAYSQLEQTRHFYLVSDRAVALDRHSQFFSYACPHLFPFAANSKEEFASQFSKLRTDLDSCHSYIHLRRLARSYYQGILDAEDAIDIKHFRAVLLAEDKAGLLSELQLLEEGLAKIFDNNEADEHKSEIKTPKGSYFTREPLGEEGKVAFVFPGLGSSYIGLGQKIFQLFPSIFRESFRFTQNVGKELQETTLYPRTQDALTFKEKRQRDMDIVMNLKDLGKTDTTYSSICAHVMTDVFKVKPDMAFGYSMGEANMMTALDVWKSPTQLEERFKQSDIFKNKLYGELGTVKKFWGLPASTPAHNLWSTFTLKASRENVEQAIKREGLGRVYLTLHNTDDNLVIAGEPESCMKLIQTLGCRAIPMGFVPAIHCEITAQEYEGIAQLYSLPTTDNCNTKLYSSSCYLPVPIRQKAIAYAIAKCFCEPVDFPRLVNKVYHDGARIFLEAGAGRTCSTWIDKILHGQKHVIVPLNAKGTEDSLTFARVMAKLFCHKVDVSLYPLYDNVN